MRISGGGTAEKLDRSGKDGMLQINRITDARGRETVSPALDGVHGSRIAAAMKQSYVIGLDFGTLSGRALLVNAADGEELAEAVFAYPHGVMDETLPCGRVLPPKFALQHPEDYLEVLKRTVPEVLRTAGVRAEEIAGVGVDFTASTVLPVDGEGVPLCMKPEYVNEPHAYVKLWKHHAAQPQADEINALARERCETWLEDYGGSISCEWLLPKLLELLRGAPELYARTARFTEAGDWLSLVLTGEETHSAAFAGYKALWNAETGYPSDDFLTALDPRLHGAVGKMLSGRIVPVGGRAGVLCRAGAELCGLAAGIPLAVPMIDGHAAMPALAITGEGDLMMVIGTSCNQFVHSRTRRSIPGICGHVRGGVIPGMDTYEAGQACAGDAFDWFVQNAVPVAYAEEARRRGVSMHQVLRERAMRLSPGESGLLALDWLNGNRCLLGNTGLSGMMLGMTLRTRPEDMYRAWIESVAYGSRMILEQFEAGGIPVRRICAGGGIAQKDEMLMQIYADVLGREICAAGSSQASALGSAVYAAAAAGIYPTVEEAARKMAKPPARVYKPKEGHHAVYNRLYAEYCTLHDYFGKGQNKVMERIRGDM